MEMTNKIDFENISPSALWCEIQHNEYERGDLTFN